MKFATFAVHNCVVFLWVTWYGGEGLLVQYYLLSFFGMILWKKKKQPTLKYTNKHWKFSVPVEGNCPILRTKTGKSSGRLVTIRGHIVFCND